MTQASYRLNTENGDLVLYLRGEWRKTGQSPEPDLPAQPEARASLRLEDDGLGAWDSMLMVFVLQCHRYCRHHGLQLDVSRMPPAVERLLALATAVETRIPPASGSGSSGAPAGMSGWAAAWLDSLRHLLDFTGGMARSLARLVAGRADTRGRDLLYFIAQVGPRGFGIITLTSVLVGMILAYLGSVQLRQLGAEVFVADLVAIGMTREMGALMTAVILAGRTGASYAAQIGTMQVNEEIAALRTLGLSVMDFLVLPRLLALLLIMPLLTVYADVLGMIGGAVVATSLDVSWNQFINQIQGAIGVVDFLTGLVKSFFFALIIGVAGCRAGLQCGRDANAVGLATTSAVVRALVWLIVVDAMLNILYDNLGL